MKISVLGTNGLLSTNIGKFCNINGFELDMYGLEKPYSHSYTNYFKINLLRDDLNFNRLKDSDLIIYAVGAGIQSNLKENTDLIFNLNVTIPIMICNHLNQAEFKGRFVTFGSYFEIGTNTNNICFSEDDLLKSQNKVLNDYSISKRLLSRFANSANLIFTYWHFVLPTIYGEMESEHRLIPYTIKSIDTNSDISFTSGDQIRQYIYIDDVINIIFDSVNSNLEGGIYNISGVEEFTVKELVKRLYEFKGRKLPENVFGKTERVDSGMKILRLNGEKLLSLISYIPCIKISDVYDRYTNI